MNSDPELSQSGHIITESEKELADKRYRILDLQRKIAMYEKNLRESKRFNLIYPERERAKLRSRLQKYKKMIGQTSKSDKSLVDLTIEYFEKQRAGWKHLDVEIDAAKQRIASIQGQLSATQRLIQQLEIPEFKCDLLNFEFREIFDFNNAAIQEKILSALKKMEFHKDDIEGSRKQTAELEQEIKMLTPPPRQMRGVSLRRFNVSVRPAPEMERMPSYERAKLCEAMKCSARVFIDAQKTERLDPVLRKISARLDQTEKKVEQAIATAKKPMPVVKEPPVQPKDPRVALAENKQELAGLVHETKECQADLDTILTEIPKIRTETPQGLLKWRESLLKQRDRMRTEYEREIKRAREQLADAKVIRRSRVNSLVKKVRPVLTPPSPSILAK